MSNIRMPVRLSVGMNVLDFSEITGPDPVALSESLAQLLHATGDAIAAVRVQAAEREEVLA
jgi:hypothetical protein